MLIVVGEADPALLGNGVGHDAGALGADATVWQRRYRHAGGEPVGAAGTTPTTLAAWAYDELRPRV